MAENIEIFDNLEGSGEKDSFRIALGVGEILVRGQVAAYNTSTAKIVAYDSAGSTGVNVFYGIVMYDADYAAGDRFVDVFVKGRFNSRDLVFANPSLDQVTQSFINDARLAGIILKPFLT